MTHETSIEDMVGFTAAAYCRGGDRILRYQIKQALLADPNRTFFETRGRHYFICPNADVFDRVAQAKADAYEFNPCDRDQIRAAEGVLESHWRYAGLSVTT